MWIHLKFDIKYIYWSLCKFTGNIRTRFANWRWRIHTRYFPILIVLGEYEVKHAMKGSDALNAMWTFQQSLRSAWKYGPDKDSYEIWEMWFEHLNEAGIDLDNLIS